MSHSSCQRRWEHCRLDNFLWGDSSALANQLGSLWIRVDLDITLQRYFYFGTLEVLFLQATQWWLACFNISVSSAMILKNTLQCCIFTQKWVVLFHAKALSKLAEGQGLLKHCWLTCTSTYLCVYLCSCWRITLHAVCEFRQTPASLCPSVHF